MLHIDNTTTTTEPDKGSYRVCCYQINHGNSKC